MILSQPHAFHAVPLSAANTNPFAVASKHVRMAYNPYTRKHWSQGGDFATGSGDNRCFEWDIRTNTYTLASTYCHAPGKITPLHPDESPVIYDLQRRKIVAVGGNNVGGSTADGTVCRNASGFGVSGPDGSTYRYSTLSFPDATREWIYEAAPVPRGTAAQADPVRDEMITFSGTGRQNCNHIRLSDYSTARQVNIDGLGFGQDASGNGFTGVACQGDLWAQDNIGRKAYVLGSRTLIRNFETVPGSNVPLFFSVDLDTDAITILPQPPLPAVTNLRGRFNMMQITWDARRRAVVWFRTLTVCGTVLGVYVYWPRTQTWQTFPVTSVSGVSLPVRGNTCFYDPDESVHCLSGGVFCGDENGPEQGNESGLRSTQMYLWQLGPQT